MVRGAQEAVMKRVAMAVAVLGIPVAFVAARTPVGGAATEKRVERGRYLVNSIGCGDCHTPKKMGANGPEEDHARMLSGHPEGSNFPPPPPLGDGRP
jgi:mono/diheme cytochrome c family protein